MRTQPHFSKHDLQQLLDDCCPVEMGEQIELHLQNCDHCRQELESLAAEPDVWGKVSTMLVDDGIGDTVAFSSSDLVRNFDEEDIHISPEITAGYSIRSLLDPPSHPEMLGRLGHYEIEREIGRGGMGVVLKAHDTELNRAVAIKVMAPHLASVGAARERFAREARSAAAILHPNVIAIHGVTTESPTPWLVMPYIMGPSLEQIVSRDGPLEEKEIVRFGMQIAAGLAAAHSQGVVHRDIKPANVLIESGVGRVVITDFGLARAESDASMTQTGWFAGTPNFMSPEQVRGMELDHRSDLFSLGSVLYFMATGRMPFRAEMPMAVLERIRNDHPAPARRVNSSISATLSNLIEHLLAKQPEDRIQTAAEVHQLLEQYLAHLHHPDARKSPVVKTPKRPRRAGNIQWAQVAVASAASLALAFTAWLVWYQFTPKQMTLEMIQQSYGLQETDEFELQLQTVAENVLSIQHVPSFEVPAGFHDEVLVGEIRAIESAIRQLERVLPVQSAPTNQPIN
ncbi:MAG: serine/threonine-protein kinase [Pirellulaceae bacterium]